jgi:hypothetical protein
VQKNKNKNKNKNKMVEWKKKHWLDELHVACGRVLAASNGSEDGVVRLPPREVEGGHARVVTAYGQQVDVPAKPPRPRVCARVAQVQRKNVLIKVNV